jgi:hypothetical protein
LNSSSSSNEHKKANSEAKQHLQQVAATALASSSLLGAAVRQTVHCANNSALARMYKQLFVAWEAVIADAAAAQDTM